MLLVFAADAANPCCFDKALCTPERSRDPDFLAAMTATVAEQIALAKIQITQEITLQ
jgi:hypothetical protein